MIARWDKVYSFADSLGQKRTDYDFLTKKNRRMVPRKLQKLMICVDSTHLIQPFFFLISNRHT